MRSGTSFFDWTVYRKTFTRFWPIWTIHLVIWLFILPFNGIMQQDYGSVRAFERFVRNVGDYAQELGLIYSLVFALVVAMAVCSHLYNHRSANFMGALPTRREGLFLSTWLAGLTMMLAPNVLIFLLTLLVEVISGVVMWIPLLYWLAAMCGMQFFFYCFAVCLGQFTGHVLVLPFFYAIFNVIAAAAYALLNWVMRAYYFGFFEMGTMEGGLIYWCTPVMALLTMDLDVMEENGIWITDVEGLWIAGIYAVVAVILTVCALLLYRRRHLETAGDIVAVKAMRPVFKYGVAACVGLFLGMLMYEMFGFTQLGLMIAVVLWGVVGYFVAQMLLDKTLRVFKKWKGATAVVVAFLLLFAVIGFDLTGYEIRVPNAEQVESVRITGPSLHPSDSGSYLNATVTDEEAIADVIALHKTIVEFGEDGEVDPNRSYSNWMQISFTYQMSSGQTMRRSYFIDVGKTLRNLIQEIADNEQVRRLAYNLDDVETYQANGGWIVDAGFQVYSTDNDKVKLQGSWYYDQADRLWEAVMRDFEARRIGMHTVRIWDDEPIYGSDERMILSFQWGVERNDAEDQAKLAAMGVITEPAYDYDGFNDHYSYLTIRFAVTEEATETCALLNELLMADNRYQDNPNDNPLWRSE